MLFSTGEIDALRLLRWCRYIHETELKAAFGESVLSTLRRFRFIQLYQRKNVFLLTEAGNQFLDAHLAPLPPKKRPSYREVEMLRRTRVAGFAVTAYRAGLSVFHTELSGLAANKACFLTSQSRVPGSNPWGSARIAAVAHLGDTVYGVQHVAPGIGCISFSDETNALLNNTAHLKPERRAIIYTGKSYEEILSVLAEPGEEPKSKLVGYGEAYRRFPYPVLVIPSTEQGAQQLRILCRKDYRSHMTRLGLGPMFVPPPKEFPEWDAMYQSAPLVMAADMDLKRIDAAAERAFSSGYPPIQLVALKGQEATLWKRYKAAGLVQKIYTFHQNNPEIQREIELYTPSKRQFETKEGAVIDAPPIQADRKTGR